MDQLNKEIGESWHPWILTNLEYPYTVARYQYRMKLLPVHQSIFKKGSHSVDVVFAHFSDVLEHEWKGF